jgi:hypothetical protein
MRFADELAVHGEALDFLQNVKLAFNVENRRHGRQAWMAAEKQANLKIAQTRAQYRDSCEINI